MNLRIVNKKRFIISTTITLLIICLLLYLVFSFIISTIDSGLDDYEKINIRVKHGDTLWKIAKKHNDGSLDIRTHVEYIKYLNDLNSSEHIVIGQVLLVPTLRNTQVADIN